MAGVSGASWSAIINGARARASQLPLLAGLAIGYFALAWISGSVSRWGGRPSALWPANALVVAALLSTNYKRWPSILVTALTAAAAHSFMMRGFFFSSMPALFSNTLEQFGIAFATRRLSGEKFDISRTRDLATFGLVATILPWLTALPAAVILHARNGASIPGNVVVWAIAHGLGVLVVTPALLLVTPRWFLGLGARRRMEAVALWIVFLFTIVGLASQSHYQLTFVALPIALLITFRFETQGAAAGVLTLAIVATAFSIFGKAQGGIVFDSEQERLLRLQVLLAVVTVSFLPIGSALADRRRIMSRYKLLADNANDLIIKGDLKGRLIYVSPSAFNIMGYRPEELIGSDSFSYVHPEDVHILRAACETAFRGQGKIEPVMVQYRVRHRDGRMLWFESRPKLVVDPETNRPSAITDVAREISERKTMEMQLREARDKAEAASVAKAEFLSNMSHELRTPLTSILGFAELLADKPNVDDDTRHRLRVISSSSAALLNVVNDILDFSKIEAGLIDIESLPVSPDRIVEESVELVSMAAQAKGVGLAIERNHAQTTLLLGDGLRLRQVVLNLIGNAIKFTDSGHVTVSIARQADGGSIERVEISIADTGIGIEEDRIPHLFERFTQADSSITRRFGGTGLGLAISHKLVDLMGGEIRVESRPDEGSTFTICLSLPVARVEAITPPQPVVPAIAPATILLAEDVEVNRELIVAILSPFGHSVDIVHNGREAVDAAATKRYDLILMDVQMPELDGMGAASIIRSGGASAHVPILALTASVLREDIARCREAGMDDHIGKPIRGAELVARVSSWLKAKPERLPVPDCEKIETLRRAFGDAKALALLDHLADQILQDLEAIAGAVEDGAALRWPAHNLRGAAGSFGFDTLSQAAKAVEELCVNGEYSADAVARLNVSAEAALAYIRGLKIAA